MSTITLRPTSTVANGSSSIGGGAGTRHDAVDDDSDSTYVDVSGTSYLNPTSFGFTPPSLDPGDVVLATILGVKARSTASPSVMAGAILAAGDNLTPKAVSLGTTAITTTLAIGAPDISSLAAAFWKQGTPNLRLIEVFLAVRYLTQPTVTVNEPSGTLTETNRPTVEWEGTFDADSDGQAAWQVKVLVDDGSVDPDGDDAIAETIIHLDSATSWTLDEVLPNDDYVAAVRVGNATPTGLQWSAWGTGEFTVNVSPPDEPSLTLTDQPSDLRVKIDVTPDNSPVATDGFVVERSTDGGAWEQVTEETGGSPTTIYDYLAPSGVEVTYRASGWNDTASDRLYSAWADESITPASNWRIIHPTDPTLSFALEDRPDSWMRSVPGSTKPVRQSFEQALNAEYASATLDTPGSEAGQIVFATVFDKLAALDELLSSPTPLWLAGRAQDGWRDLWVVFGDRETSRIVDKSFVNLHEVTLPYTEVEAP